MARNPGPGKRADDSPERSATLSADPSPLASDASSERPFPEEGEPSWPEDPEALRVETLTNAGDASTEDPTAADPEVVTSSQHDDPGIADAEIIEEGPASEPIGTPWRKDGDDLTAATTGAGIPDGSSAATDGQIDGSRGGLEGERPAFAAPLDSPARPSTAGGGTGTVASTGPSPARRSGAGAMLLGGAAAAALGFGAAWLAQDRLAPTPAAIPSELEERLAAIEARPLPDGSEVRSLADRLSEAEARLASLEDAPAPSSQPSPVPGPVDLGPLREDVAAGLAEAEDRAAALEERLAVLEARPAAPTEAPLGSLAGNPGPALRAATEADAGSPADLEPRLVAIEGATTEGLAEVRTALDALGERVETTEAALSTLGARSAEAPSGAEIEAALSDVRATLEELRRSVGANDEALSDLAMRLDETAARLTEAEAAGAGAAEEARAAAAALAEARSRVEAAEAQARREAALGAMDAALDTGEPFGEILPDLGTDLPEALTRAAADGIPSLANLRDRFPAAARAGLAAARSEGLVEEGGVLGFLSGQLSLRSTAPREGSDSDAVLSRAEAALARGRLDAALAELEALPEPVQASMADWIAQARARAEAEAALASLRSAEPDDAQAD